MGNDNDAKDVLEEAEGYLLALFTALMRAHKHPRKKSNISAFIKERLDDRKVSAQVNVLLNCMMGSIRKTTRLQREYLTLQTGKQPGPQRNNKHTANPGSADRVSGLTGNTDDHDVNFAKAAKRPDKASHRPSADTGKHSVSATTKAGSIHSPEVNAGLLSQLNPHKQYRISKDDIPRFRKVSLTEIPRLPERDMVLMLRHSRNTKVFPEPLGHRFILALSRQLVYLSVHDERDEVPDLT